MQCSLPPSVEEFGIAGNRCHTLIGNTLVGTHNDNSTAQNRYEIPICKTGYHR